MLTPYFVMTEEQTDKLRAFLLSKNCDDEMLLALLPKERQVQEMRLCESSRLCLRPNLLYHFTIAPDCELCIKANKPYEKE